MTEGQQYVVDEPTSCWVWLGPTSKEGYGTAAGELAHRSAWAERNGPLPEGMIVHHICGNRRCVNPEHLVVLPQDQHALLHRSMCPAMVTLVNIVRKSRQRKRRIAAKRAEILSRMPTAYFRLRNRLPQFIAENNHI